MGRVRVAADIGGTFTDIVAFNEDTRRYEHGKVSTTPEDLSAGVLAGIETVVSEPGEVHFLVHGTTVGLNAFLQRRGERVLLLATAGTGDVYHIARGNRTRMYDVQYRKPEPLVPRHDIVEIRGRLNYAGEELEPLDEEDIARAIERARDEEFTAVAVAFLFSYVNPTHERRVEEMFRGALPHAPISLSHRVAREWREYERTSSTVLDAYISPVVAGYLGQLDHQMRDREFTAGLHVMQSSGGIVTARSARERPLQTLLSGPVGGAMGGTQLSTTLARPNLILADMGGTSFDVSLIADGAPDVSPEMNLEGFPILMSVVNIHTIGAGGGSVAYLQAGGLRVGPESAGAVPGPACYARGGNRPTVTDANVVLGRIDPMNFLGGAMHLDTTAAERAVAGLAAELGLGVEELAEGIIDVINAKMAQAIRRITVQKGIEPREFTLVAYGGAGPMHAPFLAQELEIREVVVPRAPGTMSAWGMLRTDIRHDLSRAFYRAAGSVDVREMEAEFTELEDEARGALANEDVSAAATWLQRSADVRYEGQEYAINISITHDEVAAVDCLDILGSRFHGAHHARHGHSNPQAPVEFVALRLTALGDVGHATPERMAMDGDGPIASATGFFPQRRVIFARCAQGTHIIDRSELAPGSRVVGPAIVEEHTATTVVPPGCELHVDAYGSLVITIGKEH